MIVWRNLRSFFLLGVLLLGLAGFLLYAMVFSFSIRLPQGLLGEKRLPNEARGASRDGQLAVNPVMRIALPRESVFAPNASRPPAQLVAGRFLTAQAFVVGVCGYDIPCVAGTSPRGETTIVPTVLRK